DDLPGANLKIDIAKEPGRAEIVDPQDDFARLARNMLGKVIGHAAPDHHLNNRILARLRPREAAHILPIAQDADLVAEPKELRHPVGNGYRGDDALLYGHAQRKAV